MSKKGIHETPIVFRVTEKDFESIDDWNRYVEYQEWLTKSNKRSEFNRLASIEKTMRYLNGQEEKWKQLEKIIDGKGIDWAIQMLTNPPAPTNQNLDLNELAAKVAWMIESKNISPKREEKNIDIPKEAANKLMGLIK